MAVNIEQEIIAIVSDISGADTGDITLETNFAKDLEMDSIKAIEIAVAIEKKFKVSVRDEDIPKIMTLRQARDLVSQLLKKKNVAHAKD